MPKGVCFTRTKTLTDSDVLFLSIQFEGIKKEEEAEEGIAEVWKFVWPYSYFTEFPQYALEINDN